MSESPIEIKSRDFWVKVVDMLQQNWALIETGSRPDESVVVYFIHDGSGVFDRMTFASEERAARGLRHNGFQKYEEDQEMQRFISPPEPPFREAAHPNGPIYSSGRFWDKLPESDR